MTWLAVLRAVLALANGILAHVRERNLLAAGEAKAIAESLDASLEMLARARLARDGAAADFDRRNGVPDDSDPNLRD